MRCAVRVAIYVFPALWSTAVAAQDAQDVAPAARPSLMLGSVAFGVNAQTNANSGQEKGTTRIDGVDQAVDATNTERFDVNAFVSGFVFHMMPIESTETATLETALVGFSGIYRQENSLEFIAVQVNSGLRFVPMDDFKDFSLKPAVQLGISFTDSDKHTQTAGASLEGKWRDDMNSYTTKAGFKRSETLAPSTAPSHSREVSLGLSASYALSEEASVSPAMQIRRTTANSLSGNFDELRLSGTYNQDYEPLFDFGQGPWQFSGTLDYTVADFHHADSGVDASVMRRDQTYQLTLNNSIKLDDKWSFDAQALAMKTKSNLPNFPVKNLGLQLSFSRSF